MLRIIAAFAAALACAVPAAAQDKRVALVIGNAKYVDTTPRRTAVDDANDIGAALTRMGFSVNAVTNASHEDMERAIVSFGEAAKSADIALFYYAGHAIQARGEQMLIPVDSETTTLFYVMKSAVTLDRIAAAMQGVRQLGVVLIDAARHNPFPATKEPARRTGDAGGTQKDLLIGFATAPDAAPLDIEGRNSPFAAALLKHIERPDLELMRLMSRVRVDVMKATGAKQMPWTYATLTGDRYLTPR